MSRSGPTRGLLVALFAAVVGTGAVLAVTSALREAPPRDDEGEVVVSAAASLTDVLTVLAEEFEAELPSVEVTLNLGGSATLAEQVVAGAPIDVIASADPRVMDRLDDDGLLDGGPTAIATAGLVLAVPAGDPAGVTSVADLADPDLLLGLCVAAQPCGRYAREALAAAGLDGDALADTADPDVRALLGRIRDGELDAGIVYATDARAAGAAVEAIPIDGPTVRWEIAVVTDAPNVAAADSFVAFVLGPRGAAALTEAGFTPAVPQRSAAP